MSGNNGRKVLEILQEKDDEISKLRNENEEIKNIEKDIESKLKQTEMLLEAHEIANRQRDDNQEIERLEKIVEEMKNTIDFQKQEIVNMAESLRKTQKECGLELGKYERLVEKKNNTIGNLKEEIIVLRSTNTKINVEKREAIQKNSIQKNEIKVLSERIRNSQLKDLDFIFEKLKTEEPSSEIQKLQEENHLLKSTIESSNRENERLFRILEDANDKKSSLEKKIIEKEEEIKNLKFDHKKKNSEYRNEIVKIQNVNEQYVLQVEKLKNVVQEKSEQLNHVNQLFSQTKDRTVVLLNTKFANCVSVQRGLKDKLRESQQEGQTVKMRNQCLSNELRLKSKYVFELEARLQQQEEEKSKLEKRVDEKDDEHRSLEKKNLELSNELNHVNSAHREAKDKNKQLFFQLTKFQETVHKRDHTLSKSSISSIKQIQKDILKKVSLPKNANLKEVLSQIRNLNQKLDTIVNSSSGPSSISMKRVNLLKKEVGILLPMFEEKILKLSQSWQKAVFQKHRTTWELERVRSKYLHLQKIFESVVTEKEGLAKTVNSWKKKCSSLKSKKINRIKKDKEVLKRKNRELAHRAETMKGDVLKLVNSLIHTIAEKEMALVEVSNLEHEKDQDRKEVVEKIEVLRERVGKERKANKEDMKNFWVSELNKLEFSDTEKIEHLSNQIFALKTLETHLREKEMLGETLIHSLYGRIEMLEKSNEKLNERIKKTNSQRLNVPKISDFVVESNKEYRDGRIRELREEIDSLKQRLEKEKMKTVMNNIKETYRNTEGGGDQPTLPSDSTIHPNFSSVQSSKFVVVEEEGRRRSRRRRGRRRSRRSEEDDDVEEEEEEENVVEGGRESVEIIKKLKDENMDLVSRITVQKLEIDELQNQIQEKEVEIGLLRKYFTTVSGSSGPKGKKRKGGGGGKKASSVPNAKMGKQLSQAVRQQSITQRKLIKSLNQEIQLRNQIIERDRRIKELRSSLESLVHSRRQSSSSTTSSSRKKKKKEVVLYDVQDDKNEEKKNQIIELKSEINFLQKKLSEESLKNAKSEVEIQQQQSKKSGRKSHKDKVEESIFEELSKEKDILETELSEKNEIIDRLESERASSQIDRDGLSEKFQRLEEQYTRMKESHSKQKKVITKLTLKLNEEVTRLKESEKVISELHQHRDTLNSQVGDLKKMMEEKNLKIDHGVLANHEKLANTMENLRREQLNIQKLMKVITNLRSRNDTLLEYKKINITLKQRIDDLEDQVNEKLENKDETESKLKDAKGYIQVLRSERFRLQEDYRLKMSKLKKDFLKLKGSQQKEAEEHLLIIESLEQELETLKREKSKLEETTRTSQEKTSEEYDVKMKELENKHDVVMKKTQISSQQIQNQLMEEKSNLLSQLQERNEEVEKLMTEKEELEEELKSFQRQFDEFKNRQESIFQEYSKNTKQLQSRLSIYTSKEKKKRATKRETEKYQKKSLQLERSVKLKQSELEKLQGKNKEFKQRIQNLQKKHREEKKNLKMTIEKLKKNVHSEKEWKMISDSLKNAKKALKETAFENQRKTEIINSLKSNFNQEISKLETSINEHKRYSNQFREVLKEKNRRNQILKDYKAKVEEYKKKIKTFSTRISNLRSKVKDLTHENNRKDQYVKSLQLIISKKEEFGEELKLDVNKNRSEISKRENRIKQLTNKIERVTQEEKLKSENLQSTIHELKKCVLEIGSKQVRKIKKLEEKVIRFEQMMEDEIDTIRRKKTSGRKNLRRRGRNLILDDDDMEEEEEEEDIISMASSSMATSDIIDVSSSSASSFGSGKPQQQLSPSSKARQSIISHRDIGLSLDEMADIMSSTTKRKHRSKRRKKNKNKKKKIIKKKKRKNQLIDDVEMSSSSDDDDDDEEIERPKSEKAQKIFNQIRDDLTASKKNNDLISPDQMDCKDQIEALVNIRIGLEKSKLILEKKQFFAAAGGGEHEDRQRERTLFSGGEGLVFNNNDNHSLYSKKKFDLEKENLKLKNDVQKMKEKEIIYENTVNALEKQLLQD